VRKEEEETQEEKRLNRSRRKESCSNDGGEDGEEDDADEKEGNERLPVCGVEGGSKPVVLFVGSGTDPRPWERDVDVSVLEGLHLGEREPLSVRLHADDSDSVRERNSVQLSVPSSAARLLEEVDQRLRHGEGGAGRDDSARHVGSLLLFSLWREEVEQGGTPFGFQRRRGEEVEALNHTTDVSSFRLVRFVPSFVSTPEDTSVEKGGVEEDPVSRTDVDLVRGEGEALQEGVSKPAMGSWNEEQICLVQVEDECEDGGGGCRLRIRDGDVSVERSSIGGV